MKTHHCCSLCKQHKPIIEFSKHAGSVHGIQAYCKECAADRKFRYRYNITTEQFNDKLKSQGNSCAVCKVPVSEYKAKRSSRFNFGFVVDHDHTTGEVRGILCNACNVLLGHAFDSQTILANAIEYLEHTRKKI